MYHEQDRLKVYGCPYLVCLAHDSLVLERALYVQFCHLICQFQHTHDACFCVGWPASVNTSGESLDWRVPMREGGNLEALKKATMRFSRSVGQRSSLLKACDECRPILPMTGARPRPSSPIGRFEGQLKRRGHAEDEQLWKARTKLSLSSILRRTSLSGGPFAAESDK